MTLVLLVMTILVGVVVLIQPTVGKFEYFVMWSIVVCNLIVRLAGGGN